MKTEAEMRNKIQILERKLAKEQAKLPYVLFYCPGPYFCKTVSEICEKGNIKMALRLRQRFHLHYASAGTPFCFEFTNSNEKALSGKYYVTGRLIKYCDVIDLTEYKRKLFYMRHNNTPIVIANWCSYKFANMSWDEFAKEESIVDLKGNIIRTGKDADLMEYRAQFKKEKEKE